MSSQHGAALDAPGFHYGMSPAQSDRARAIAFARRIITSEGEPELVNLARQLLRALGIS